MVLDNECMDYCPLLYLWLMDVLWSTLKVFKGPDNGTLYPLPLLHCYEVLSYYAKNTQESDFKYHFGCKEMKITHLCFADDLMVFCHGDYKSAKVIKKTIEEFSDYSGLHPNLNKSTIFFRGVCEQERSVIINTVKFHVGKLPMKYLGVPLLAKCLGVADCKILVDKIYWASVLPKIVIKEIDKVLKSFIWNQESYNARFNKGACIADMIQDGKWIWPDDWWSKFPILKQIKVPSLNNEKDFVRWLNKEGVSIPFSIRGVWINMRYDYPKVDWYKVVWFSQCTPKHAVIMWLAIQNRLQTNVT
ncbi:RNA-directed DNA polymerase, eukaryota, reverse transcriptase zinc-binding domain protein [Tanacetum coccineum]